MPEMKKSSKEDASGLTTEVKPRLKHFKGVWLVKWPYSDGYSGYWSIIHAYVAIEHYLVTGEVWYQISGHNQRRAI